jgi:hypothetical protein
MPDREMPIDVGFNHHQLPRPNSESLDAGSVTMGSLRGGTTLRARTAAYTRPIFFQLMFDQVMFGSTLLAIPGASMFLFEGLAIGSTGVSSVSIEASALAAC